MLTRESRYRIDRANALGVAVKALLTTLEARGTVANGDIEAQRLRAALADYGRASVEDDIADAGDNHGED